MKAQLALMALVACAAVACDSYNNNPTGGDTPLHFSATLTGDAERPNPLVTSATGTASFTVTTGSSSIYGSGVTTVTYSVSVSGLSGDATAAHIHGPADANTAAGVIVPLTVTTAGTTGVIISGSFTSTGNAAVSIDSLVTLLRNGNSYVNVHTSANQAGEVRGQIH